MSRELATEVKWVHTEELLTVRMHRHAKPLNQVESQWSGLNPESGADVPRQALLLLGETSFVLWDNNESELFPMHSIAQHQGRISTHLRYLPAGVAVGELGPREERHQLLPDSLCYWQRPAASPPQAFPQQRQIGLRQGRAASAQEKDFRSCYTALLNLPFDPWGKGPLGSWKAIVCLLL